MIKSTGTVYLHKNGKWLRIIKHLRSNWVDSYEYSSMFVETLEEATVMGVDKPNVMRSAPRQERLSFDNAIAACKPIDVVVEITRNVVMV